MGIAARREAAPRVATGARSSTGRGARLRGALTVLFARGVAVGVVAALWCPPHPAMSAASATTAHERVRAITAP